jgi:hypothetical protein
MVNRVTGHNGPFGAFIDAETALKASLGNFVRHDSTIKLVLKQLLKSTQYDKLLEVNTKI